MAKDPVCGMDVEEQKRRAQVNTGAGRISFARKVAKKSLTAILNNMRSNIQA